LQYKEKFAFVYHFLADDNSENVPGIHNRDGGIIKLFAKKIPHDYGRNTVKRLLERTKKSEYDVLELFLEDFIAECKSTRDRAIASNNEMLRFTRQKNEEDNHNRERNRDHVRVRRLGAMEDASSEFYDGGGAKDSEDSLGNDLGVFDVQKKITVGPRVCCNKKIYFDKCDSAKCDNYGR
jgi:hypothetical protein